MTDAEKQKLLTELVSRGITDVVIAFDGSGDSGEICDITTKGLLEKVDLTQVPMEGNPQFGKTLFTFLEHFGETLLSETGVDWYNNEGGWGNVHIVPAHGMIEVDMNVRITSHETTVENLSLPEATYDDSLYGLNEVIAFTTEVKDAAA